MAWLDDRVWCHPKILPLSDRAFRVHISAITYSSGMGTKGFLTASQQRVLGTTTRARNELISAGLWDVVEGSRTIKIHDWDEHNAKRDERKARDRERKRLDRMNKPKEGETSAGQGADAPQDVPQDTVRTERGQEGGQSAERRVLTSDRVTNEEIPPSVLPVASNGAQERTEGRNITTGDFPILKDVDAA